MEYLQSAQKLALAQTRLNKMKTGKKSPLLSFPPLYCFPYTARTRYTISSLYLTHLFNELTCSMKTAEGNTLVGKKLCFHRKKLILRILIGFSSFHLLSTNKAHMIFHIFLLNFSSVV